MTAECPHFPPTAVSHFWGALQNVSPKGTAEYACVPRVCLIPFDGCAGERCSGWVGNKGTPHETELYGRLQRVDVMFSIVYPDSDNELRPVQERRILYLDLADDERLR